MISAEMSTVLSIFAVPSCTDILPVALCCLGPANAPHVDCAAAANYGEARGDVAVGVSGLALRADVPHEVPGRASTLS